MRLLAIGDIHVHLKKLQDLMAQVQPTIEDQCVFLGDYIDRGPNSQGVLEYLINFEKQFPHTVFLLGNHEQMMLDYLHSQNPIAGWTPMTERSGKFVRQTMNFDPRIWMQNGGTEVLNEYQFIRNIPQRHIDFLLNCRLSYKRDDFIFTHAGAKLGTALDQQDWWDLLWEREFNATLPFAEGKVLVTGHTPCDEPSISPHRIDLDTGSGISRYDPLTCMDVSTHQIWQSPIANGVVQ